MGVPVRLHPETEQCLNLKVAKVFVKADLSKELPKSMNFTFEGKKTLVEYSYPWLPPKCTVCGKWGHYARVCRHNGGKEVTRRIAEEVVADKETSLEDKKQENERSNIQETEVKKSMKEILMEGSSKEGEKEIILEVNSKEKEGTSEAVVVTDQDMAAKEVISKEGSIMEILEKATETSKKEEGKMAWVEVSPGKTSRTPPTTKTLEFDQVSILSNSRFAVLSQDEEEGEIIKGDSEEVNKEEVSEKEDSDSEIISSREEDTIRLRQYLPRGSKTKHKYLSDVSVQRTREDDPSDPNKKKKPRNSK